MSYLDIKKFRKSRKKMMIKAFGSKCQICGYDKCDSALEFHHLDPTQKDFAFSNTLHISWDKVKNELKKCICVCANCHREIHEGLRKIDNKLYFDESLLKIEESPSKDSIFYDKCPICGKLKLRVKKFCSHKCACQNQQRVDWSKIDLLNLIDIKGRSIHSIAKELNISWQAVKKHYNKLKNNLLN